MLTVDSPSVSPVAPHERYEVLDVLRGFALLGIVIVNLNAFNGWFFMPVEAKEALPTAAIDGFVAFLQRTFIVGKFYTLFSLLFGIGFAIQFSRAAGDDGVFRKRYARRLTILVCFGLVHFCMWKGDILTLYALCGFLLIVFRNANDRLLLTLAAILILLPIPYYTAMWLSDGRLDPSNLVWDIAISIVAEMGIPDGETGTAALLPVLKDGGIVDMLRVAVPGALMRYGEIIFEGRMFKVFGVFLVGLWVGRRLMEGRLPDDSRLLRRVFWIGIVVGLPANLAYAMLTTMGGTWPYSGHGLVLTAVSAVGTVPLAFAYAAGLTLLLRSDSWERRLQWLAPVGRLALSNYLGQTVIAVLIFYGVGLGLMGTVGTLVTTMIAIAIFFLQTAMSLWWSRYFRFGPLEWVWRQLTFGRRFPIRRERPPGHTGAASGSG